MSGIGEEKLSSFVLNYEPGQSIGEIIHKRLLSLLRSYCFVGGMSETVSQMDDLKLINEGAIVVVTTQN